MNRIVRKAAGAAALLAALPLAMQAQTADQRVERALERALQVGVPVELLQSKVAEGRAKGVPMERIAQAVERRLQTLEQVGASFGQRQELSADELGVAADALQAGVSATVLATLSERAPRDRRAVAIAALTELVKLGHASDVALERVTEAMQRGPEALMNLPAQAAAGRGRGGPPEDFPGRGAGVQSGRGGPPAGVQPGAGGAGGRGRGRGGPPGGG
jgi:hypothetical protein